jgi:hypothetical protein
MKADGVCDRRSFLRTIALAGGGAVMGVIGGRDRAKAASRPAPRQEGPARYRETEHVRKYYRSARG